MDITKLLTEIAVKEFTETHYALRREKLPKTYQKGITRFIKQSLTNKKVYHSYTITSGVVQNFIMAQKVKCVWRGNYIKLHPYVIQDKKSIQDVVKAASSRYGANIPIYANVLSKDSNSIKQLKSIGFKESSYTLTGLVSNGYRAVSKATLPTDYQFEPFNYETDINQTLRNEDLANLSDPTSYLKKLTPRQRKKMKEYYQEWSKKKTAFVIKHKKEVVAFIGVITRGREKYGFIGSIWVHPDHQGIGLAKFLYRTALELLMTKNYRYYGGHTSTTAILKLGKKMKREKATTHLKLE